MKPNFYFENLPPDTQAPYPMASTSGEYTAFGESGRKTSILSRTFIILSCCLNVVLLAGIGYLSMGERETASLQLMMPQSAMATRMPMASMMPGLPAFGGRMAGEKDKFCYLLSLA